MQELVSTQHNNPALDLLAPLGLFGNVRLNCKYMTY